VAVSLSVFAIIAVSTRIVYGDDLARWLLILLICFSVLHNEPVGLLRFELEAKGYLARLAVFRLVTSAARIVLMWAAIEMRTDKSMVVALLAVEQLLNSGGYWICYRSVVGKPQISVSMLDVRSFTSMVQAGAKYWLGFVALYFFVKFDRLFFSLRLDAHDYGIYAAGANMAEQVSSLGIMLVGVLAPAAIYAKSKAELVPALKRFVVAISLVGVAAAVTAFFLAPVIIFYIFGPKYAATLGVFKTLVIVAPLTYVDTAAAVFLFKMNRSDLFIRKSVVALAVAAVFVSLLYPFLGWRAAPLANCLALVASIAVTASAYKNFKSLPHAQEN
jgi:O-antigen/teichoic acid export membrane protein